MLQMFKKKSLQLVIVAAFYRICVFSAGEQNEREPICERIENHSNIHIHLHNAPLAL